MGHGKKGPCRHCGVTSTPLWRNGPPDKPVLCNACGSRYRTRGTLANYMPLHAMAQADHNVGYKVSRQRYMPSGNNEVKELKRKRHYDDTVVKGVTQNYIQGCQKSMDEDASNRSSSGGSAISYNEDANDLADQAPPLFWDSTVPSRKGAISINPKPSSMIEKLNKDLCDILQSQSSECRYPADGDLIFESDRPMVNVEIGVGCVLLQHPSTISQEEESEISSLSVDNKGRPTEANSQLVHVSSSPGIQTTGKYDKGLEKEELKRNKDDTEEPPEKDAGG